jgi:hypothetical protein
MEAPAKKKQPTTKSQPPRVRETLVVDAATFGQVVSALHTLTSELPQIMRDLNELKTLTWQIGESQQALSGDITAIARAVGLGQPAPRYSEPPRYAEPNHNRPPAQPTYSPPPAMTLEPRHEQQRPASFREALRAIPGIQPDGTPTAAEGGRR